MCVCLCLCVHVHACMCVVCMAMSLAGRAIRRRFAAGAQTNRKRQDTKQTRTNGRAGLAGWSAKLSSSKLAFAKAATLMLPCSHTFLCISGGSSAASTFTLLPPLLVLLLLLCSATADALLLSVLVAYNTQYGLGGVSITRW